MKHFKGFTDFVPTCTWHEGLELSNIYNPNIPEELLREFLYSQQAGQPVDDGGRTVAFQISSCGKNWYEARREFAADTLKVVYDPDTLRVISYSEDAMHLFPHGNNVVEVAEWPDDINLSDFQYNPTTNKVEKSDGLALKRVKLRQTSLLRDASAHGYALSILSDKTDEEKAELKMWNDYIRAVKRTNLNQADIVWPDSPK